MTVCTVGPCERPAEARGLCHSHFEYQRRTGTWPTHRIASDIPWEERFWARTTPGENGCILWTASTASEGRYGICSWQGKVRPAHVVAYLAFRGEYDQTLDMDHLCRVTLCVNPLHLEPVTHRENILRGDGWGGANSRKVVCLRGHDLTDPANVRRYGRDGTQRACRACQRHRSRQRRYESHLRDECSGDRRCPHCRLALERLGMAAVS